MNVRYRVVALLVSLFATQSCVPDKCGSTVCYNEGVCVEAIGECACKYGYEGTFCEDIWHNKFSGSWYAKDSTKADGLLGQYDLQIAVDTFVDTMYLIGLVDTLDTVWAYRRNYTEFELRQKALKDSVTTLTGGTGIISDDRQTVTGLYTLQAGEVSRNILFTWTR